MMIKNGSKIIVIHVKEQRDRVDGTQNTVEAEDVNAEIKRDAIKVPKEFFDEYKDQLGQAYYLGDGQCHIVKATQAHMAYSNIPRPSIKTASQENIDVFQEFLRKVNETTKSNLVVPSHKVSSYGCCC